MSFDIRQLKYAIGAADHGSFYKAARSLDIEQSTLSRNIIKLERALGMPIFERTRAGVTPTLAGSAFLRGARPMLESADKLVSMMRAAGQGRAGGLVVGHNSSVSAGNLRTSLASWHDVHPEVSFECVEADRSVLFAEMDVGEIDVAILMGAASKDGYRCECLWSERLLVALPYTHPLAERNVVLWTDLRGERVLFPAPDPGREIRDILLGRLSGSGARPDIEMRRSSRETILSTLGIGSAVSIVCEGSTGVHYPDVVYRPIHGEQGSARNEYCAYWHKKNENPALGRFLGYIKSRYALNFDIKQK